MAQVVGHTEADNVVSTPRGPRPARRAAANAVKRKKTRAPLDHAPTTEIYLEEPQNLTATENGLEIFLDWDVPPSGIGVGDPCVDAYGYPGFLDSFNCILSVIKD